MSKYNFPYLEFMKNPAWSVIQKALNELEYNDDIALYTAKKYITGYLVQSLFKADIIENEPIKKISPIAFPPVDSEEFDPTDL